jgi:hypothetical protein
VHGGVNYAGWLISFSSPAIEITFSTRDTEFMKDSIKYADMKLNKADFVPLKV